MLPSAKQKQTMHMESRLVVVSGERGGSGMDGNLRLVDTNYSI